MVTLTGLEPALNELEIRFIIHSDTACFRSSSLP